jgi:N-acetylneuraminic acid mutarotase
MIKLHMVWPTLALAACATANAPGASITPAARAVDSPGATGAASHAPAPSQPSGPIEAANLALEAGLLAPMPTALTSFGAASDGQYLYIAGGYHGTPHQYSREGQVQDIQRLALTAAAEGGKDWQRIGALPEGTQGLALIEHNGRVCRFGGSIAENSEKEETRMRSSNAAACFDVKAGTWQALPDLPKGLSSHAAARVGSTVYVVGGWTLTGDPRGPFNDQVYSLDLSATERGWQAMQAPAARRGAAVAAAGDSLVVFGGMSQDSKQLREVAVYDTRAKRWSAAPEYPEEAFGGSLASAEDGSVVGSASSGKLFSWKPGQKAWQPAGTLAFPRYFHQLVKAPEGGVVAVGGINGMHATGRIRQVERRQVVGPSARAPQLTAWSMDSAGTAKNRQAAFVSGDYLYLFGGNNSLGQHDFSADNFVTEGVRVHLPTLHSERLPPFPMAAQSMVVAQVGERVFSLGGFGPGPKGALTQSEIFEFNSKKLAWERVGSLPHSRTQFGVATQGDRVWVIGGLNYDPERPEKEAFEHVLDVLSGSVDKLADTGVRMTGQRRAFAGGTLDGQYYLIGGMRNDFELVDSCARFDLASNTFSDLVCPAQTRLSGSLAALGGKLYLVGGSAKGKEGLEASPAIDVFDPAASSWSRIAYTLPFNTRHAHVLTYGDRILIASTHNEEGRIRIALLDVAGAPATPATAAVASAPATPKTNAAGQK